MQLSASSSRFEREALRGMTYNERNKRYFANFLNLPILADATCQ
jgi:hypothetical protein